MPPACPGCSSILNVNEPINFDDIRPYRDSEVAAVVTRLVEDRELVDTLARMKFARLSRWLPFLLRTPIRIALRREFSNLNSVQGCQQIIEKQLRQLLNRAAEGITITGLDKLDRDRAYLYIGNHRDIAMDPAMVNFALAEQGRNTTRIAIGDNLLSKPFVSDLMRLNKSFVVKRSTTARREKLVALKKLSAYIDYSLTVDKQSVWIAQREGRAKDGMDCTETAVLKMLVLNRPRDESFGEAFGKLSVVPVAVSYEWDPCDAAKARELYARQTTGNYEKREHEDIESIYRGIVGEKGHIEIAFGTELQKSLTSADAVCAEIDRQIIGNYRLQASHLIAFEELYSECSLTAAWKNALGDINWASKHAILRARLSQIPPSHRDYMLNAYANPVKQRIALSS